MSRRQRHINPGAAGAVLALDSRFMGGLTTSSVDVWPDRTSNGNNAEQPTVALQPEYQLAAQGGQPSIRFDGINDLMSLTGAIPVDEYTFIGLVKKATAASSMVPVASLGGGLAQQPYLSFSNGQIFIVGSEGYKTNANGSFTGWSVISIDIAGTAGAGFKFWLGGVDQALSAFSASATATELDSIGANSLGFSSGSVSSASVFDSVLNDSTRKRMEQCIAFSFKLPCS